MWGSCFSLCTRRCFRPPVAAPPRLRVSHPTLHMALTPTHHTALSSHTNSHHTWLSHQLITQHSALTPTLRMAPPRLSLSRLTPHMALRPTHHRSGKRSSHTNSHSTQLSHHTPTHHSSSKRSSHITPHTPPLITQHTHLIGFRVAFVWQAPYTEPS